MSEERVFDISLLYVEDEEDTRELLALFLGRRVRQLLIAANGLEGLELYRKHKPDIVVTDIRMPFMNGLAMAREIKKIDWFAKVIVTTAHSDTAYFLEAIESEIDGYALKPLETEKLLLVIEKCVEIVECRRAARILREEREKLIVDLQVALDKVKLLSGFLPICASCKKIRDDKGYWQQIEAYIREHSEAEFSHSICPDCAKKLYSDYYKEKG